VFDMVGPEQAVRVVLNLSGAAIDLPEGELLLASQPVVSGQLPAIAAAWVARPPVQGLTSRIAALAQDVAGGIAGAAAALDPRR
jgi:hypothetical protein